MDSNLNACIDNTSLSQLDSQTNRQSAEVDRLQPAFSKNNVAILLAANDRYAPYLTVVLQSIAQNSSKHYNYDIIIFTRDISITNQRQIQQQIYGGGYGNIAVRFYDVTENIKEYTDIYIGGLSLETYYRLLAPYILTEYDKVLYLDCDVLVLKDVANLFFTDLHTNNYLLAAANDPYMIIGYQLNLYNLQSELGKTFPIDFDTSNYLQAGVILMHLTAFRQEFTVEQILNLAKEKNWLFHDQDILNFLTYGRVFNLDMRWNVIADWLENTYKDYKEIIQQEKRPPIEAYNIAKKSPYILHYAAGFERKPWSDDSTNYAAKWWKVAKKTNYYPILKQNLKEIKEQKSRAKKEIRKQKFQANTKKVVMPVVNFFFPKGSKRRAWLKRKLKK